MSAQNTPSNFLQTTGGKIGVGVIVVIAICALVFEITHAGADDNRTVPAQQVISEAQQQIDAINKMTNLSPAEKKAMIAHEQGEIGIAQASGKISQTPPGAPPTSH